MVKRKIHFNEDVSLMLKAAKGDRKAYSKIYCKYFSILADYAKKLNGNQESSEDIAQEVFFRVWKQKEDFRGDSNLKTYLFSHVRNILHEERYRQTKVTTNLNWLLESYSAYSNAKSKIYPAEFEEALKKAISELSPKQRQAISLFYTAGMSLTKAAKHCNCSTKAFESRLIRARKRLRQLLGTLKP